MAKEEAAIPRSQPPLFSRFLLWEIMGIVGFLHILLYAPAKDPTPLFFLANSVVFVLLYPTLYFYSQLKIPAVLKVLIMPLSVTLRILLMASSFFWITYLLYATEFSLGQSSCFLVVKQYWMFLAPVYIVDYFFFFEHLWGLSRVNFSFWSSLGMISDSVSGVVGGFYLGRTLITKWGNNFGSLEVQGLIWSLFILIGVALVVWFGNKTRKG
jgi:uncharacterized membrane protein YeaQ/YmgE (transglycosylase-associated protein family)